MTQTHSDEIIDVEDLYEENEYVVVKTLYYSSSKKLTYSRIEIGKKDSNNDITEFIPITVL